MYIYAFIFLYVYNVLLPRPSGIYMYIWREMYVCMYIYICTHTYIYITCMYISIYTCIRKAKVKERKVLFFKHTYH